MFANEIGTSAARCDLLPQNDVINDCSKKCQEPSSLDEFFYCVFRIENFDEEKYEGGLVVVFSEFRIILRSHGVDEWSYNEKNVNLRIYIYISCIYKFKT